MAPTTAATRCPHFDFDHRDQGLLGDALFDLYDELRAEGIGWSNRYGGFWIVTRYDDVRAVLKDHETFSSAGGCFLPELGYRSLALEQDPPEHGPFRKLYANAVGRSAVEEREPALAEMIDRVVGEFAAAGGGDARAEISEKIPVEAVALMFGLSPELAARVREMTTEAWKRMDADPHALGPLSSLLTEEVLARREAPQDDFLSRFGQAEVEGRRLTDEEIGNFMVGAVVAGHETTMNASSNLMLELARHPSEQARMRDDPRGIDRVIDESLRHRAPIHMFFRTVRHPTRLHGQELAIGDKVAVVYAAANRDPDRFPEPQEFSPEREDGERHVSFGWGIHRCVGAFMAQTELRLLTAALLAAGTIRLAGEPEPAALEGGAHMGLAKLPLTLSPN